MWMMQATLIEKKELTHDVYELHYKLSEKKEMLPGQFITFILPWIWWRSYSILELKKDVATLIIKKWPEPDGGRWGSIALCDANTWDEFKCVGPAGHFILTWENTSRCFIGTGTWFVPLYNQILWLIDRWDPSQIHFVFWVRTSKDLFYKKELEELSTQNGNFSYSLYLSRETEDGIHKGYVTDFLSQENVTTFEEYYLCWAPAMIESCQNILNDLGVKEEKVFFEKYS